jgi:hypothetical protein
MYSFGGGAALNPSRPRKMILAGVWEADYLAREFGHGNFTLEVLTRQRLNSRYGCGND